MRKILSLALFLVVLAQCMTATVNAEESKAPKTIKVEIVINGKSTILEGEAAQDYVNQKVIEEQKMMSLKRELAMQRSPLQKSQNQNKIEKSPNTVTYYYTYEQRGYNENAHRPSLKQRITQQWKNSSSITQSHTFSYSSSSEWSINLDVSGKFKEAVTVALGGSWTNKYSASDSVTMNVPAGKTMYMTYYPIMKNSWGYSQKWMKGRYSAPDTKMEEVWVDTYSPKSIYNNLLKKNVPDGVYEWVGE